MGLDQTQPPFFPILDIEMASIMSDLPFAKGGVVRSYEERSDWLLENVRANTLTRERAEVTLAEGWPNTHAVALSAHVLDATFLRTWAANIADDAKEPSQDA